MKKYFFNRVLLFLLLTSAYIFPQGIPDTVEVDRFSSQAGHLFIRDESNSLPAANAPIAQVML